MFLPYKRVFYSDSQHQDRVFHISLKPMHGYGKKVWKPLNKFYMDCMRRVIGAHKSASSFGVLVRMGVFPLQYEFAFRAVLWYLKIFRGDSDPVLTKQLEQLRSNDESFVLSCFYRHAHAYVEQLSRVGGVNLFTIEKGKVKTEVKKAMYIEVTAYWRSIGEARVTKSIHPQWQYRRLSLS